MTLVRILSATLISAGWVSVTSAYAADGRSLVFDAYRSGTKIGTHTLRFLQDGEKLTVDIAIDFKGKAFIIPFSYSHRNREIWQGNKLLSLESRTVSNGKSNSLQARADSNMLKLVVDGKPGLASQMFSTSYWNGDTINQKRLLNSQKGDVIELKLEGTAQVRAPKADGTSVIATEYRKSGSNKFNIAVQYDSKGCLVGMNFKAPRDVTRISYKLVARPNAAAAPDLLANPVLRPCLDAAKIPA
jgi:hypothetical protein